MAYDQPVLNQTPPQYRQFATRPLQQSGIIPVAIEQLKTVGDELAKSMHLLAGRLMPVRRANPPHAESQIPQVPEIEYCELANTVLLVKAQLEDIQQLVQRINETLEL